MVQRRLLPFLVLAISVVLGFMPDALVAQTPVRTIPNLPRPARAPALPTNPLPPLRRSPQLRRPDPPRPVKAPPSGAIASAPANATFDAPVATPIAGLLNARGQPTGNAPFWEVTRGEAKRDLDPMQGAFAKLDQDDATMISSAFSLEPGAKHFGFHYRFFQAGPAAKTLRVFILSGPAYAVETELPAVTCTNCGTEWQRTLVDVSKWSGQNIKVKFVRPRGTEGPIGIDNVAQDLLEAHIGRDRRSAKEADPVNTTNGNFEHSTTDLAIPGRGVSLNFTRDYNSNSTYTGNLGPKWTHTYSISLSFAGGCVGPGGGSPTPTEVRYADGHTALPGTTPGNFDTLAPGAPGTNTYVLTTTTQVKYTFELIPGGPSSSCTGRLKSIADRNNNLTTVNYAGSALAYVEDPGGRRLTFTGGGRITQVSDPLGRTVTFAYHNDPDPAYQNLIQVTDVAGKTWNYAYENGNTGKMVSETSPLSQQTFVNHYDALGRVFRQVDRAPFPPAASRRSRASTTTAVTRPTPTARLFHTMDTARRLSM